MDKVDFENLFLVAQYLGGCDGDKTNEAMLSAGLILLLLNTNKGLIWEKDIFEVLENTELQWVRSAMDFHHGRENIEKDEGLSEITQKDLDKYKEFWTT